MDYYNILGINKNATQEEIKKAYRKLAMKHHPDRGGDNTLFQKINEAYNTLGDPQKRAQYDSPQPQGFNFNFGGGAPNDINEIFSHIFGQRGHNPFNQSNEPIYRTRVGISLVEAYNGEEKMLQMQTPSGTKVIKINIPKGVYSGHKIRYNNVIDKGVLIVEFVITPDLRFERKNDDLYSNLPVSVLDLIVGTKVEFTTISGKKLEVNIKPQTQPHMQLKIPKQGMPSGNGDFGDQILLIKPYIPANIDQSIIEAINNSQDTK